MERGTKPVIPLKSHRKLQNDHYRRIYRQRNSVNGMFCRSKEWRRTATKFHSNIKIFMGSIAIAAVAILWPEDVSTLD
jgi:transposase